jgi:hypothetical protein
MMSLFMQDAAPRFASIVLVEADAARPLARTMPAAIFISYASEDAPSPIASAPARAGRRGVLDRAARHRAGTSFPAAITAAIQSCSAQVLLLTPQANASRHVLSEVELAFNAGKPILAVLVGKVTPSPTCSTSSPPRTGSTPTRRSTTTIWRS